MTIWTNQLSQAQRDLLLLLADRREEASGFKLVLNNRCEHGIVAPYEREKRTVKALVDRGLVKWVWVPAAPRSGITLTQLGADTLEPPGKVTQP